MNNTHATSIPPFITTNPLSLDIPLPRRVDISSHSNLSRPGVTTNKYRFIERMNPVKSAK